MWQLAALTLAFIVFAQHKGVVSNTPTVKYLNQSYSELFTFNITESKQELGYWFDGKESIYIFGVTTKHITNPYKTWSPDKCTIHKLNITSTNLELLTTVQRPEGRPVSEKAVIASDPEFNLYHFGGEETILKYNPNTNTTTDISFPNIFYSPTFFQYDPTTVLVIETNVQDETRFYSFNLLTHELKKITTVSRGSLPHIITGIGENVYMITDSQNIRRTNIANLETKIIEAYFPRHTTSFGFVSDEKEFLYIIGGYAGSPSTPSDAFIRVDPTNSKTVYVHIDNYPVNGTQRMDIAPDLLYINSIQRLYLFGGWCGLSHCPVFLRDKIWYIDMAGVGENDGVTPNPPEVISSGHDPKTDKIGEGNDQTKASNGVSKEWALFEILNYASIWAFMQLLMSQA